MQLTPSPDVDELLDELLAAMQRVLGSRLVGLYLYGSLVTGDFDPETSDVDLLAATATDVDDRELDALHSMHDAIAGRHQRWEGRIEVKYLSLAALRTFKTQASPIASISPGEPFHRKEAGKEYLVNWYVVQEKGITLYGPSPRTLIEPISREEFVQVVRWHAERWTEWIQQTSKWPPAQAYAILTMCRALYTAEHGEQVSKKRAALWAQNELPAWAPLIADALKWRAAWRDEHGDGEAAYRETIRFVHSVIDRIIHGSSGHEASTSS